MKNWNCNFVRIGFALWVCASLLKFKWKGVFSFEPWRSRGSCGDDCH